MNNVKDIRKVRLGDGMTQFPPKAVEDAAKVRLGDGMTSVSAEGGEGRREGAARRWHEFSSRRRR